MGNHPGVRIPLPALDIVDDVISWIYLMLLKARHGYSGSERCGRVIVLGCKSMYNMSTITRLLRNILNRMLSMRSRAIAGAVRQKTIKKIVEHPMATWGWSDVKWYEHGYDDLVCMDQESRLGCILNPTRYYSFVTLDEFDNKES